MDGTTQRQRGFTLIELLVVIAIIALLIGILLPALGSARDTSRGLKSLSNQRQLVTALTLYATDNRGLFPPNVPPTIIDPVDQKNGRRWFDEIVLGDYIPQADTGDFGNVLPNQPDRPTLGGGVMQNPNHFQAGRSYSMNYWASSYSFFFRQGFGANSPVTIVAPGAPNANDSGWGRQFNQSVNFASSVMLLTDGWGQYWKDGDNDGTAGGFTGETVGSQMLPGQRFGLQPAMQIPGLFTDNNAQDASNPEYIADGSFPESYIPFYRHPARRSDIYAARGRAQIAFADGSVRAIDQSELVDQANGRSSYRVLWSEIDQRVENQQLGNMMP